MNSINALRRWWVAFALAASTIVSPLASAGVIPDTAAGKVLRARLEAFASGSAERLTQYKARHEPRLDVAHELLFYRDTGGFDLLKVEESQDHAITAVIRARDADSIGRIELTVEANAPERVAKLRMYPAADVPAEFMPARLPLPQVLSGVQDKAEAMAARQQYAGSLLIAHGDQVLLSRSWGHADRSAGVANTADTRFRIASMYKMFTAVAVLQLVEARKLDLDGKLADYLDGYPNRELATQVSIRQLLTHTAGTGDIFTEEYARKRPQVREHKDYLALFGKRATEFTPGTASSYSNYGFVLLGAVIERVSGGSYDDYLQAHVFGPAGMRATGSLPENQVATQLAVGYTLEGDAPQDNRNYLPWRGTAAGGGYSTVGDLQRFVQALRSGRLLSGNLMAQATRAQNADGWYGYGFSVGGEGPLRWFGHDGGAEGMSGSLRVYPELGYMLVSLANLDPPASERLTEYFSNRMPVEPKAQEAVALMAKSQNLSE